MLDYKMLNAKSKKHAQMIRGLLCTFAFAFSTSPTFASSINMKVSEVCRTSSDAAFRAKYCSAAKDLKKGFVANQGTAAIWGGVTTVCGLACGKVGVGGMACKISSMGGSAGEGVLTKKFTDAIMGEGTKAIGDLGKESSDSVTDACTAAGTSALKSYTKLADAKLNERSVTDLRDQTKGMNAATKGATPVFVGALPKTEAATAAKELCNENALKTARGTIACAASVDPTLPGYVKTEEFLKDIQKATGKSADDFFAGFESPAKSLFEAPGISGLSSAAQNSVAESLAAIEGYSNLKVAGKIPGLGHDVYRTASTPAKAPSSDDLDVASTLKAALGQLNGGEKADQSASDGADSLAIGGNRKPAGIISPEDRTISIFDRVEWRYHAVSTRDHLGVEK